MDDLMAFVTARLDEDERDARAATPGPWRIPERDPLAYCVDSPDGSGRICRFGDRSCGDDVHNSLHIVRHDPARALREVTTLRHILFMANKFSTQDRTYLLLQLADIWSDHPDYRDEWKP
jgi:hypothetical protein